MVNIHEAGIAKFLYKNKRDRFFEEITHPKKRPKLFSKLGHNLDFIDEQYMHPVPTAYYSAELIHKYVKELGAPDICFAISEIDSVDGKEVNLLEALRKVRGFGSSILSCIPGKLAYYEGEDDIYILKM